jgi:hypothetical protein
MTEKLTKTPYNTFRAFSHLESISLPQSSETQLLFQTRIEDARLSGWVFLAVRSAGLLTLWAGRVCRHIRSPNVEPGPAAGDNPWDSPSGAAEVTAFIVQTAATTATHWPWRSGKTGRRHGADPFQGREQYLGLITETSDRGTSGRMVISVR